MAVFQPNVPVTQKTPQVQVDVTPAAPLAIGPHRFQLIVVDDSGNLSTAATLDVIVKDTTAPTAVLDVVNAAGQRIDPTVPFGQPFLLSGVRSSDAGGGKVVEYRFMLVPT
jgi:hypothetical protein